MKFRIAICALLLSGSTFGQTAVEDEAKRFSVARSITADQFTDAQYEQAIGILTPSVVATLMQDPTRAQRRAHEQDPQLFQDAVVAALRRVIPKGDLAAANEEALAAYFTYDELIDLHAFVTSDVGRKHRQFLETDAFMNALGKRVAEHESIADAVLAGELKQRFPRINFD